MSSYTLFDTAIGVCGVIWNERAIIGVQLPEPTAEGTLVRVRRRFPDAVAASPSGDVVKAIAAMMSLLAGEQTALEELDIDLQGASDFERKVYAITRRIPPGSTKTYGAIATELGDKLLAQQVGVALGRNPVPIIVPCHRVLAAKGKLGGFSAPGGSETKRRMLVIERAFPDAPLDLFD